LPRLGQPPAGRWHKSHDKAMTNKVFFNDFIQLRGHRVAYNKFINSINQKLATPVTTEQKIGYLDFCSDFVYGEKQELYRIFAELLSAEGILKKGRDNNRRALYRWVCSPRHSNIGIFPQTMERAVSEQLRLCFNRN
jgi:hypothetical protein